MKNYLTLVFLWLGVVLAAQPITSSIKVHVEDGCGNAFTKPVTIDLYKVDNSGATQIATSTSHPALFNNLDPNQKYEVRIASSENSQHELSVKDIYTLTSHIFGLFEYTLPFVLTGDISGNSLVSTLDLVQMNRHIVRKEFLDLSQWYFLDKDKLNLGVGEISELNKVTFENLLTGPEEVTLNGYKHGAVKSATPSLCNPCTEDSLSSTSIKIPDIDVEQGKEVVFDVEYDRNINEVGMLFSMLYQDATIQLLTPGGGTTLNHVDSISTIHIFNYYNPSLSSVTYREVLKIKFIPLRSGKLTSFFSFNELFRKEFIYKDGNCLKTYQNISMKATNLCPVTWPEDISVPDCQNEYSTGWPIVDPDCVATVTTTFTDQVIGTPCIKILKTWIAVNWLTGEIFEHIQVITIDPTFTTICTNQVSVLVDQSVQLYARDLIKNALPNHVYSFSSSNPDDSIITLFFELPYRRNIKVYNLTEGNFCIATLELIGDQACTEPINVINQISLSQNNGLYVVTGSMFDGGNVNHCLGSITNFEFRISPSTAYVNQASFDFNQYKNSALVVSLRYQINGVWVIYGDVKILFLIDPSLPPLELSCFDDPVTKNELYEIAFFSPNFDNIYALQAAIKLKNATMVSTKKKALKDINFNEELRSLRFVWLQPTANPLSVSSSDTLFTMTIRPSESGNIANILSIADDLLPSEAVLNDLEQTKINLVFKFLKRSVATEDADMQDFMIYPNPSSSHDLRIVTNGIDKATMAIYNDQGQMVYNAFHSAVDGQYQLSLPTDIAGGIYLIRMVSGKTVRTKKLVLLK